VHGGGRHHGFGVVAVPRMVPHALPRAPPAYRYVLSGAMRKMIDTAPDTALPAPLQAWTHCDALSAL
jgi:hypothetical protein